MSFSHVADAVAFEALYRTLLRDRGELPYGRNCAFYYVQTLTDRFHLPPVGANEVLYDLKSALDQWDCDHAWKSGSKHTSMSRCTVCGAFAPVVHIQGQGALYAVRDQIRQSLDPFDHEVGIGAMKGDVTPIEYTRLHQGRFKDE